jgi:hypothetical protein
VRAIHQRGRITVGALLLALLVGVGGYVGLKYGPVGIDYLRVKALVGEAGQRAVTEARGDAGKAWFDQRVSEEGFGWLSSGALFWERIDREHYDVGVRYEVTVEHLAVGPHTLVFSYYCTATKEGCRRFTPEW